MDITELDSSILSAIIAGRHACAPREIMEMGFGAEAIQAAIDVGLVAAWDTLITVPHGMKRHRLITLTPLAAEIMRVQIDEVFIMHGDEAIEEPFWVGLGFGSLFVKLPARRHECELPFPERVVDPASIPDTSGPRPMTRDPISRRERRRQHRASA